MNFDSLELIQKKLTLAGQAHVMVEASEAVAVRFNSARGKATRMVKGEVVGVEGAGELQPLLVSLCLYRATKEGELPRNKDGEPDPRFLVPERTVRGLPSRIVKKMFKWIRETSDLDEVENKEVLEQRLKETQEKLAAFSNGHAETPAKNGHDALPSISEPAASSD